MMTGSASDKPLLRPHIYSGQVKKRLEKRFKDLSDPLQIVIVAREDEPGVAAEPVPERRRALPMAEPEPGYGR